MDSLSRTPRKSSRKLTVRFIGDKDVDEFIQPLKDVIKSDQEKQEVDSLATPRSAGRRTPRVSQRKAVKAKSDEEKNDGATGDFPLCKMELDFDEEGNLSGKQLYGFRTPKKDSKMNILAPSSMSKLTPKSSHKNKDRTSELEVNVTPVSKKSEAVKASLDLKNSKTPYNLRKKIKKRIENMVEEDKSDFSSSESEYNPSDKDDSSDDEEAGVEEREESSFKTDVKSISIPRLKHHKYMYSPEDYFSSQKSKGLTSNHTLSRLKTPKISHSMLKDIIKSMESNHRKQITKLNIEYEKYFRKWLFCMRGGHSILLYGLGSKRNTLNSFHQQFLSDCDVVVINGFFPSLSMKKILNCITEDIMDLKSNPAGILDTVRVIESVYSEDSSELFLIVHNIDGATLRNEQSQTILSRLSSIKNIHVIASVDHINSPLLWDPLKLSLFNFLWFDITTMLPYIEETSFENSVMVKQSGALALSSLRSVYNSLTSNAKGVFLIILKYQLEKRGKSSYVGISFRDLYWKSREAFLLSSDLALRAQLTEFVDHHIIKSRTGTDGEERLSIPLDNPILQDFLDEQNE